jgi:E3 ubiquitin-protein ligase EDD1
MPFALRQKTQNKLRSRSKKSRSSDANRAAEITVGSQVCLKSSPIYNIGATGFTVSDGVPRVGQLMEAVWAFTDTSHFKVKALPVGYVQCIHIQLELLSSRRMYKHVIANGGDVLYV